MKHAQQKNADVKVKDIAIDSLVMAFGFAAGLMSFSSGPTGAQAAIQLKNSLFSPSKI